MASISHAIQTLVEAYSLMTSLPKRLVPTLVGSPGVGKSSAVYQAAERIAAENGIAPEDFSVVEMRPVTMDPAEIAGFRIVVDGKTVVTEADWFPQTKYGVLFLDEIGKSQAAAVNALSEVMLDHRIGTRALPPGWMVCAATNRLSDRAGEARLAAHIQDRMLTINVDLDPKGLQEYAIANHWYDHVPIYFNYRPEFVHHLDADGKGGTPRSWEMVSNIKQADLSPDVEHTLTLAALGEEIHADWCAFERVIDRLPNIADLIADPEGASIDHTPDITYALMGALATNMARDPSKASGVIRYLDRLDQEWAFTCMTDAERFSKALGEKGEKIKPLSSSKAYTDWLVKHKDVFIN